MFHAKIFFSWFTTMNQSYAAILSESSSIAVQKSKEAKVLEELQNRTPLTVQPKRNCQELEGWLLWGIHIMYHKLRRQRWWLHNRLGMTSTCLQRRSNMGTGEVRGDTKTEEDRRMGDKKRLQPVAGRAFFFACQTGPIWCRQVHMQERQEEEERWPCSCQYQKGGGTVARKS